jgi:multidrug efflux pump subunit AcrA (membrane-fusion protein)
VLKTDLEAIGVVEIFQRADTGPNTQKGYLRFLTQMCELAGEFLKSHQLRHFSHRQTLWTQLEDFARVVHGSLNPRETAYTIANEGRRLIECDRLSVAICKGKHCTIEAISGQDLFDKRSNIVRLLGKLASAVVATGEPMWYTGDTSDMPPQVEDAVQEYVDESHSKTVAVLPLRRPAPPEEDDPDKRTVPEPPIGALIIEQIEDSRVASSLTQRAEVVCRHSSTAMANAKEHQDLFLMPVWRALGKTRFIVEARALPWTISVSIALVVLTLFLFLWPARFRLEAKGELEPVVRHNVFAGISGRVTELYCDHGSMVKKGQKLAELHSTELEVQAREVEGQLHAAIDNRAAIIRALDSGKLNSEKRDQSLGQQYVLDQQIKSYEDQLQLYMERRKDLLVLSPIDGEVITWDLRRNLSRRPVQQGETLMQVADPSGEWQLELHMPENRMGHIFAAQKGLGESLEVPYILATEPGTTRYGKVTEIQRSAEVHGEDGNTVLIKVAIDKNDIPQLQPGAGVTAKVDCGRRPLGYVLLHDVFEFIQTRILFKFF